MEILIFFILASTQSFHYITRLKYYKLDNGLNLSINDQPCIMLNIQIISLCSLPFYILFIRQSLLWSIRMRIKNNPLSIEAGTGDRTVWRRRTSDSSAMNKNIIMDCANLPPTVAWLWFVMLLLVCCSVDIFREWENCRLQCCCSGGAVALCRQCNGPAVQLGHKYQQLQSCIHRVNSKKIGKNSTKVVFLVNIF